MNGAQVVLRALADQGVDTVFGYPGGAILPVYDALFGQNAIRHILVRHEQAAVHAAEGYARTTGKTGVVFTTSGPGATNAVTGLTDALMDSVPIVCLTGQVPTHLIGNDAFQECDTTGITRPCTKHNYLIRDPDQLAIKIHEAFYVASKGRPGPVVVDLPKDVQFAEARYVPPANVRHPSWNPVTDCSDQEAEKAVELLASAKHPIIYAGGGIINSGERAVRAIRELVALTGFPCTLTLMGLGVVPASRPEFLGMLGMHGTYEANMAMNQCDVMLCAGARFDDRVTGNLAGFSPGSRKIHIDIDPSSINKSVPVELGLVGDCGKILERIVGLWKKRMEKNPSPNIAEWWKTIAQWRAKDCLAYKQEKGAEILPQHAIRRLWELTADKREVCITTEVGQHQMWAAQYFHFEEPKRWMTSGGLGTMGYGFPAAIGVQCARPEALVIDIAGDASILMNLQELSTAVQYRLPVKIFILNNRYLGMVRQWQELIHSNRLSESYTDSLPDFVKLAEAYGCVGVRAETSEELDAAITTMIETKAPVIADIRVAKCENCFPMIPSGASHDEMIFSAEQAAKNAPIDSDGMVLV